MEIVRDFDVDAYWNKKEAELERCPVCHFCRQHIQTEKMIVLPDNKYCCLDCELDYKADFYDEYFKDDCIALVEDYIR